MAPSQQKTLPNKLRMQLHVEIDKKKVVLPDSIKTLGSTEVVIKVYANIAAKITVEVLPL